MEKQVKHSVVKKVEKMHGGYHKQKHKEVQ